MTNIQEQIYIERLNQSPIAVRNYIFKIQSNESFEVYLKKYRKTTEDPESKTDVLRNEISLLLLKIITVDEFIDTVIEALDIQPFEAEEMITDFFSTCLPEDLQDLIDGENEKTSEDTISKKINITDQNTISHVDILNEIENPTHSMETTSQFVKPAVTGSSSNPSTPNTNTSSPVPKVVPSQTISTTPTNPLDLGGFGINKANTSNPAQNIANKLGQNLSAPTTSIPKEVYVSKKLDPYKEPFV